MKKLISKLSQRINYLYQQQKYKIQLIIVSAVFCVAGCVFTIINFTNPKTYSLGIVTSIFCFLSLVTCLLAIFLKKGRAFVEFLFVVSTIIMFIYFLVFGGAGEHGFSTYWILLLPFLSMLVLGLLKGSIATFAMFLMIIFFLWIPFGRSLIQWQMEDVFIVRFPLVYLAAFASSFLFELSRYISDYNVSELNNKLQEAATHDYLTGCLNRNGFAQFIDKQRSKIGTPEFESAGAMLIDIDNFKYANDSFGHTFGDEVLIAVSKVLMNKTHKRAIRFGGDEFICLFENKSDFELRQLAEEMRQEVSEIKFESQPDYRVTISIGVVSSKVDSNYRIERVLELADYQSSRAKRSGKNTVYLISYDSVLGVDKKSPKNIYDMLNSKNN